MKNLPSFLIVISTWIILSCSTSEKKSDDGAEAEDTLVVADEVPAVVNGQDNVGPYLETLPASEGLVAVRNENGWGFNDETGKGVIACQYRGVGLFENGRVVVKINQGDWRKSFVYLDKTGKELGFFFEEKQRDSCKSVGIVVSNLDGESYSADHISRCAGGIISHENQGWEWGSMDAFFPGETIEQRIKSYQESTDEYAPAFKKFKGESTAFNDASYKVSITVEKNPDGAITKLTLDRQSETDGGTWEITLADGGVMVSKSYGS